MTKVWAFYRRSTMKQELSIEDQQKECQEFARQQGWQIVSEFKPKKGFASGLTIDRDPDFLRMLSEAEGGKHGAEYLLVYDVSRFGRLNPEEKIYWEQRFKKEGDLQVVYVKDGFRNDGSLGDGLAKFVKHSEAHEYSVKLSQSTLRGSKSHAERGHSAGGRAPYGYDRLLQDPSGKAVGVLDPGRHKADKQQRIVWTPSEEKAKIVKEIFARFRRGEGLRTIVSWLNESKIPAPEGTFWIKSQIHHMLRNRAYIGERIYNKRSYKAYRRGERRKLENPRDQWVTCLKAHPAIIDQAEFERVQQTFSVRPRSFGQGRPYHSPHLLTGIIHCANCGCKFNGFTNKARGHEYRYYECAGYNRAGASVCRSVHILAQDMENVALDSIREFVASKKFKEGLKPKLRALLQRELGTGSNSKAEVLRDRQSTIVRHVANLLKVVKEGRYSPSIAEELERLEKDKTETEKELLSLQEAEMKTANLEDVADAILDSAKEFDDLWENYVGIEERKELLRGFIYQIDVAHSPEQIKATYFLRRIPQVPRNRPAQDAVASIPGLIENLSLKSIAGVGFEPTTSRL